MKTLQELYDDIAASEELRTEYYESAKTEEAVAAFLKKYDCPASLDEVKEFLNEKFNTEPGEMSDEELSQIAGGTTKTSAIVSNIVVTVLAFAGCIGQSLYIGKFDDEDCFLS